MKKPPATPVPLRGIFTITRSLRSGRKDITPVTPLILIIAGLLVASIPQTLQAGWIRTYGGPYDDYGYWVEQTTDGGYIVTGRLTVEGEFAPEGRVYLIKTDAKGDTLTTFVAEEPHQEPASNWSILSSVGRSIGLRYADMPQGFHASVFDATGRKVDEIESPAQNGVLTWGENHSPGVYFVRVESGASRQMQKVVLIR